LLGYVERDHADLRGLVVGLTRPPSGEECVTGHVHKQFESRMQVAPLGLEGPDPGPDLEANRGGCPIGSIVDDHVMPRQREPMGHPTE
jgi:hypothetical protein